MINQLWYYCISIRLFLAFSVLMFHKYYNYIKLAILIIGLGFIYKYLTGSNNEIQVSKVFWHRTRAIHSLLFIMAYLMDNAKNTTIVLICDVLFSIIYRTYLETK